ncbi:MAG: phage tail sheath protein [Acetatifactor muris]|nr:phage tail sheath protein [Acetatifactor muris]
MGLPEILISFQQKASSAVQRSTRGMAAILLDDDTAEQFLTPYRREKELKKEDWKEDSLKMLKLAFKGAPQKVLAVRMLKKDGNADLEGTLREILPVNIDYLAYPGYVPGQMAAIKEFLKEAHAKGKKIKAVLPSCGADCEHIINFATPGVTAKWEDLEEVLEYDCAQYACRIAGILAGLPLTQSSTYYALDEVVDAQLDADPDSAIDAGKLVLVFDGEKYKIGRGVTSLVKTTEEKPEDLKKIKIVEGMDVLVHDIHTTFEESYVGKVVNSYDNKQMFVGAVNDYFRKIQGSILDGSAENYVEVSAEMNREYLEAHGTDTADMTEQELKEANTGSWMFLAGSVKFLDAAEDLKLQMEM